ncbi:MAG: oxidoreductase [Nitrospirota bacterium]
MQERSKFAMYWASACGGCEIALLGIHEELLDFATVFEPVFWPCVMDGKRSDVEALSDGAIALTFFNGAIRNDDDVAMARLLRAKSRLLVAFGSCAYEGCIPGLSNLSSARDHAASIYLENPSTDNPYSITPRVTTTVDEGELHLPSFHDTVKSLRQTVDVDYSVPGCPPEPHQIQTVIDMVMKGGDLPPKGSVIGAGAKALCEECPRLRREKRVRKLYRLHEIIPDKENCLIDQGMVCMGPATRSGCTALCPKAGMPCIGCYGPAEGVIDQGAAMLSALASIVEVDIEGNGDDAISRQIEDALNSLLDPAGTFYKFSLAHSLLQRARHPFRGD